MGDVLSSLYGALDTLVLERVAPGHFRALTPPTPWARRLLPRLCDGEAGRIEGASPYLDAFLEEARAFWDRGLATGRLPSGPWREHRDAEESLSLEATAVSADGHEALLIQRLGAAFAERVQVLQIARENRLTQETLEAEVRRRTAAVRRREEEVGVRLVSATALRDDETGAHVRRIGLYAGVLGEALGWTTTPLSELRLAASMHDIGKIGIPDGILLKPGPLNRGEREIMERHTTIGAELLEGTDIGLLHLARDIARHHHERWDGRGYPDRLRGEEIPLAARIVCLVDVFDAMLHARVYKPAIPEDKVLGTLSVERGRFFDPRVVDAFFDRLDQVRAILEAHPDAADSLAAQCRASDA